MLNVFFIGEDAPPIRYAKSNVTPANLKPAPTDAYDGMIDLPPYLYPALTEIISLKVYPAPNAAENAL